MLAHAALLITLLASASARDYPASSMQLETPLLPQQAQRAHFEPLAGDDSAFKFSFVEQVRAARESRRAPAHSRSDCGRACRATRWKTQRASRFR